MKKRKIWGFLALGIGVVMAMNSVKNILSLWAAGSRPVEADQILSEKEAENAILKARLGEVQSDEFVEREARNKLGMVREGEVLVVIPPQSGGEQNPPLSEATEGQGPNWKRWWKLYFGQ
jgi:cell division protein FtsB